MTLQQIKYFIEVAQEKSFSQAADNLFVAQSGLSRAISNLEQELGVSLFVRGGNKKIFLTSYGESFLEYAKSAVETLDRAVAAIDKMRAPSALWGEVRLGYAYLTGCDVVMFDGSGGKLSPPRLFNAPEDGGTGRKAGRSAGQRIGRRSPLYRKVMNDCKLFHKPFMRIAFVLYNGVV